jgi:hypothetical protein
MQGVAHQRQTFGKRWPHLRVFSMRLTAQGCPALFLLARAVQVSITIFVSGSIARQFKKGCSHRWFFQGRARAKTAEGAGSARRESRPQPVMATTAQKTAITLRGSVEIVTEFFGYSVNR